MNKRLLLSLIAVSAVAALAAVLPRGSGSAPAPASNFHVARRAAIAQADKPFPEDRYRALLSRSIFASERVAKDSQNPQTAPEAGLALKGIAEDGSQFTAFVEDSSSGKLLRLQVGDALASGRVANMTLHALDYDAGGRRMRVQVGQSLSGGMVLNANTPRPTDSQPRRHFASANN